MRLAVVLLLLQSALGVDGPLPPPNTPKGLEVALRTRTGQTFFRLSELIPLEVAFRSSRPGAYRIEIADGWNEAPRTDRFTVAPGASVIDRNVWWLEGYTCCDTRRPLLRATPAVCEYELTDTLRFTEPGEYRIQFSTKRVFAAADMGLTDKNDLVVRSNVLTIQIVDDDPEWLTNTLTTALAGVSAAPPARERYALPRLPARGSLVKPVRSDAMQRFTTAVRQLRMLDTPGAIAARVARIEMPSTEEWRTSEARFGGAMSLDTSMAYSSRPDLVAAALAERAALPGFGVTRGYFDLWHRVLLERDYPNLIRLGRPDGPRRPVTGGSAGVGTMRQLLSVVRELAAGKSGVAAEMTTNTIRRVEQELAQ